MPIALPGPAKVPEGPHRDLLVRLHDLYAQAGKPATRFISKRIDEAKLEPVSYETVSALLRGGNVPSWGRLRSIITVLCGMSVHRIDVEPELVHFNDLWRLFESPQDDPPARVSRRCRPSGRPCPSSPRRTTRRSLRGLSSPGFTARSPSAPRCSPAGRRCSTRSRPA